MLILAATETLAGVAQTAATVTCTAFGMELNGSTEVYKKLFQSQLPAAVATQYTAPASNSVFIRSLMVVNNSAANPQTFQLFQGGTTAAFAITPVLTIPAGGMAVYEDGDGWKVYDNLGQLLSRQGGNSTPISAALTANSASQTSTTEAVISQVLTVPANSMQPGSSFEIALAFSAAQGAVAQTTPGVLFQMRWGGLTGTIICGVGTITPATLLAASAGYIRGLVVLRSIGATGSAMGSLTVTDPRGTRIAAGDMPTKTGFSSAPVTVNTTTDNALVLTCKSTVADAACITFGTAGVSILEKA